MKNVTISREWFDDIKERVPYSNPYFYTDKFFGERVEVDVNDDAFDKVSAELGWL